MQLCLIKQKTGCTLPTCKHGDEIIGIDYSADSYELRPEDMTPEQFKQFWGEGKRFFEPRNKKFRIETKNGIGWGNGNLNEIITECKEYEGTAKNLGV